MGLNEKNQLLLLRNLRIELDQIGLEPAELAARHLGLPARRILQAEVLRRNLDARRGNPRFILHLRVRIDGAIENLPEGTIPAPPSADLPTPPALAESAEVVVLGSGPAGLFAAWRLTQAGLRPLIVERGPAFPDRHKAIEVLQDKGKLDPEANFHFGLGGAGTYSDGKLFTRLDHPAVRFVLEQLQIHGAGSHDAICVDAHPHVGTDRWPEVLESLKSMLEQAGCRFLFNTRVEGLTLRQGRLFGLRLADGELSCQACILAPGNSSRDLFAAMDQQGIRLQPKDAVWACGRPSRLGAGQLSSVDPGGQTQCLQFLHVPRGDRHPHPHRGKSPLHQRHEQLKQGFGRSQRRHGGLHPGRALWKPGRHGGRGPAATTGAGGLCRRRRRPPRACPIAQGFLARGNHPKVADLSLPARPEKREPGAPAAG
ncbi:MAG: FAD-binding protein [Deltaproteobacteria bacterium]|nr:FAD-binding protein [Deltaproteobacteria bacterium]